MAIPSRSFGVLFKQEHIRQPRASTLRRQKRNALDWHENGSEACSIIPPKIHQFWCRSITHWHTLRNTTKCARHRHSCYCRRCVGSTLVATNDGLGKFDRTSHTFTAYKNFGIASQATSVNASPLCQRPLCTLFDANGTLWLGTFEGLVKFSTPVR